MITFITALYPEAKALIAGLSLKQNREETHYPLFESERFRLIITGSGMIAAASCAARHFSLYPAEPADIVINVGIAGYDSSSDELLVGDLFLVSKITEQMTGRTFYPDILYRNTFSKLPLLTVPVPADSSLLLPEHTLIDMEASALYQALLPFFTTERMFFFKVVSDIPGKKKAEDSPEALLAPHLEHIMTFVRQLHSALSAASIQNTSVNVTAHVPENAATEATANALQNTAAEASEDALIKQLYEKLPLTETTRQEVKRLLHYVRLTGTPLSPLLSEFLDSFPDAPLRGKKQAAPYLEQLRRRILDRAGLSFAQAASAPAITSIPKYSLASDASSVYLPFFHTVYVEKGCTDLLLPTATPQKSPGDIPIKKEIEIDHYKDIFNRVHQNFAEQKKAPSLILAKKTGTLIYEGAPVCQSFGNRHFYYTSCMMNCIYHCDYCYLQGMYPSGHVVVFVNLEDYFSEIEALLKKHPVYLCISYDTDLLALEAQFGFVGRWLSFAAAHPDLTLEIRTKSGNPAVFDTFSSLYTGREEAKKRIIFAWSVSPEGLALAAEHGAASLSLRLRALLAAKQSGFCVRLCFDPIIYHAGWRESYRELVFAVFDLVPAQALYDASIGVFRISTEYLKNMRKKRPDSALVQFPYVTKNGVSHYGTLSEEMVHYVQELLLAHLPAENIFIWNGGI